MLSLYSYFRSSASYRVRIALNLKGLDFQAVPVHLVRDGGEQHRAEFQALNPARLVPVLEDGPIRVSQSLAIIEYLEETHPQPALLPKAPPERARVRELALSVACDIHPLNNLRVVNFLKSGMGVDERLRNEWMRHWIESGFGALEVRLSSSDQTGIFCHGDTPTLADCCLVPQVFNALRQHISLEDFPTIERIYERCIFLDAFRRAAPAAQPDGQ